MNTAPDALTLRGICKSFPGVRALDDVDFSVAPGEVHGLVGENGAGKSTLIKIIAGVYQRDSGEMLVRGKACGNLTPRQVEDLGIQFIYQELNLVPEFTIAQSVFMGQERKLGRWVPLVDNRSMEREASELIHDMLGVDLPGKRLVRDLSVAERQLVQIAKALRTKPSVVAFDEPTAPLARREVERLFSMIDSLRDQGLAIIYISHYLSEITEICDRVTVLRNGMLAGTLPLPETSIEDIVTTMVGREIEEMYPPRDVEIGTPRLEVQDLALHGAFDDVSFKVGRGEVVGVTGLLGSGVHELAETIYGLRRPDKGTLRLDGDKLSALTASKAADRGFGMVPKDRRWDGVVLSMSVADNINLSSLDKAAASGGYINSGVYRSRANEMIDALSIKTPDTETAVRYLSGGNQQKVVIARWMSADTQVFVLEEPGLGVDVGAKIEIYTLINEMAAAGSAVFIVSSDIPELLGVCDRVLVMYRGEVTKELVSAETTPDTVLFWSTGGGSTTDAGSDTAVDGGPTTTDAGATKMAP
jgi:ribose transport system ATP-binding protein